MNSRHVLCEQYSSERAAGLRARGTSKVGERNCRKHGRANTHADENNPQQTAQKHEATAAVSSIRPTDTWICIRHIVVRRLCSRISEYIH